MKTEKRLIEIYNCIKTHGGYVVGRRALGAWKEAQSAYQAELIGLEVSWEYEEEDWMSFAGDPEELYRKKIQDGSWECLFAYVKDDTGSYLASLGGIFLETSGELGYRKVVEFELLAEAWNSLKKGAA